jgi:hypothetical protein
VREGTTSRVMATDRPYVEFYKFYSVIPEYFGYTLVKLCWSVEYGWGDRMNTCCMCANHVRI